MNRNLIGLPLAGLLLLGGATAAFAQSGAGGTAAEAATGVVDGARGLLGEVLDDLVGDGTITEDQADAIETELDTRREERRAEAQALREQLRSFLEDGVISAEELAQLPEEHPLRNLDSLLEDGQLTTDELRQLRGLGFGHGRLHHGPGMFFGPGERPAAPADGGDADTDGEDGESTSA